MKTTLTQTSAIQNSGCRLDASYHASPGVQALHFLQQWANNAAPRHKPASRMLRDEPVEYRVGRRLDLLQDVCEPNGIFVPGRFKRIYVDDPEHGEPWLSPSEMQRTDLSHLRYVSRKFTLALNTLRIRKGYILLSRSGTIGNMVYARSDMEGLIGSDDIIRIVANSKKIPPGYLYAYLNSPLGKALIEQKTYGAVVQHIEAHHIRDLPVPRFAVDLEQHIHELIEQAAQLRVNANQLIHEARYQLLSQFGLPALTKDQFYFYGNCRAKRTPGCFVISSSELSSLTINAWNHADKLGHIRQLISNFGHTAPLRALLKPDGYFTGSWYKRIPTPVGSGAELISQRELFNNRKEGNWISTVPVHGLEEEQVEPGMILVAGVGTMGESEVFGRCEFVWDNFEDKLVVAEVIRVVADPAKIDPGYLFAFLSSEYGFRLFRSTISGTKLCRFIAPLVLSFPVPMLAKSQQESIGDYIRSAYDNRSAATKMEDNAQSILYAELGLEK